MNHNVTSKRLYLNAIWLLVCLLLAPRAALTAAEQRHLILVAGQSNAVGFDAYANELPADPADKDVLFWWRCGDPPPDELSSQTRPFPITTRRADANGHTESIGDVDLCTWRIPGEFPRGFRDLFRHSLDWPR